MKKTHEKLGSTIGYLKTTYPEIPQHVFEVLEEARIKLEKKTKKKRCKNCDRYEHYDETEGIWLCEQCDKKPKYCPDCSALTSFDKDLGVWKCNECEWTGYHE